MPKLFAVLILGFAANVSADVVIQFTENIATGTTLVESNGSLDVSSFSFFFRGHVQGVPNLAPGIGGVSTEPAGGLHLSDVYVLPSGTLQPYGTGLNFFVCGSFSGDSIGFSDNGSVNDQVKLTAGYTSGTQLSGSTICPGTFASLGISNTPLDVPLPGNQQLQLRFASVPEPSSFLLILLLISLFGTWQRFCTANAA